MSRGQQLNIRQPCTVNQQNAGNRGPGQPVGDNRYLLKLSSDAHVVICEVHVAAQLAHKCFGCRCKDNYAHRLVYCSADILAHDTSCFPLPRGRRM